VRTRFPAWSVRAVPSSERPRASGLATGRIRSRCQQGAAIRPEGPRAHARFRFRAWLRNDPAVALRQGVYVLGVDVEDRAVHCIDPGVPIGVHRHHRA